MRDYKVKYWSMPAAKILMIVAAFLLLASIYAGTNNIFTRANAQTESDNIASQSSTNQSSNYDSGSNELNLVKPGTLTVATSPDYPPFALLSGDTVVGFEADMWNEIGKRLGLNVEVKSLNFDSIMTAVASGTQVDMGVSGISITPERAKTVAFSDPYYEADISFAVSNDSTINSDNAKYMLSDPELSFAVQSGTTAESYVRENYPKSRVIAYTNANDCFSAVSAGQADVVCSTKAVVVNMLHGTYGDLSIVKNVATGEEYGIALNMDNTGLLARVNQIIKDMKEDGSLSRFASNNNMSTNSSNVAVQADKLKTVKCSASTNSDATSEIIAGKETRITWEGQAGKNETVVSITLEMPKDATYEPDLSKVVILDGEDLIHRKTIDYEIINNENFLTLNFTNQSQILPGSYFRIEIYGVIFADNGGTQQMCGTYTTANSVEEIDDIPAIYARAMTPVEQFAEWLDSLDIVQAWNSNKFCNLFLNPSIFVRSIPIVFNGFLMALATVLCAFPIAVPIGLVFALMRLSKRKFLRAIASFYVNIVRGTPLFLQIYIAFFGLPLAGINIPNFILGLIVLAINSSAYLCEIIRAGIQSISKGQFEAARSLGMTNSQCFIHVILPQTVQRVIPTMTSEFILLFKDTSLLASVGVMEVVMYAKTIVASTGSVTPYIVAALFYLVITIPLAKIVTAIEANYLQKRKTVPDLKKQTKKNAPISESTQNKSKVFPKTVSNKDQTSSGINPDVMGSV